MQNFSKESSCPIKTFSVLLLKEPQKLAGRPDGPTGFKSAAISVNRLPYIDELECEVYWRQQESAGRTVRRR